MSSAKHTSVSDLDKPYEANVIGIRGIVYFTIGLALLIIITFALMYALWGVLEQDAIQTKSSNNPMMKSEMERLPPEPRLQGAPGFEVRGPKGAINLELKEPQAEWRALKKIWDDRIKNGEKHPETGALIAMPVDKAIDVMLQQPIKARTGEEAATIGDSSRMYFTDASSGRKASLKRN